MEPCPESYELIFVAAAGRFEDAAEDEDELAEVEDGGDLESECQNRRQVGRSCMIYHVLKEHERLILIVSLYMWLQSPCFTGVMDNIVG